MQSQGFIETMGLVGAIEAADAMTKAAAVHLERVNHVGCGIIMITVSGDLASVQCAVEAGCAAIQRIPGSILRASNVVARPAYDPNIFTGKKNCCLPKKAAKECCVNTIASKAP